MIVNIKHKGLKRFFEKDDSQGLPPDMADKIKAILARLHSAETIEDMSMHSYKLHQLKGDRKGVWSMECKCEEKLVHYFSIRERNCV